MSSYHPPCIRGSTIAVYWLVQWGAITAVVWYMMVVKSLLFGTPVDFVEAVLPGLWWTVLAMLLQLAFLAAPTQIGGHRERSKLRACSSIASGAAGATGLVGLVCVIALVHVGFISELWAPALLMLVATPVMAIVCFIIWSVALGSFVQRGRLEAQYLRVVDRLLVGTVACVIACAGITAIAMAVAQDLRQLRIGLGVVPLLFSATAALVGCRMCLKRLVVAREPWYLSHCHTCGYDLSGDLTVTHCSECGTGWRVSEASMKGDGA